MHTLQHQLSIDDPNELFLTTICFILIFVYY